ncbi:MAG: acyl-CoA synthetase FdrA [Alphaproteobacteria bacterium]|nr:acyl-CoA synthetase FdrA [Alphaproteobacteria bacterium]
MSAVIHNEIRRGVYLDSVALMRFSREIAGLPGIEEAALMMGTPANKRIMADANLLTEDGDTAEGGDLIIGIRAATAAAATAAKVEAARLLERPTGMSEAGESWRPRSLRAAVKAAPDSNIALISVPGDFAAAEGRKALRRGLHVMMFSDNVAIADEAALKQEAQALGLLFMGPDCGTSIINGAALGFANKLPRGDIGIVGASGTGIQEVSCLIARGGGGISHAIGVGGRDLKEDVGGITTLMALDLLDADPETRHIVLISKPPAAAVAKRVTDRIAGSDKTFTLCFIGGDESEAPANAAVALTLKAGATHALGNKSASTLLDVPRDIAHAPASRWRVHGLFAGGTLCAEAQVVFRMAGEAIESNAPIPGVPTLAGEEPAHPLIDLGDDEYTRGKPHPMIDPSVRDDALATALADPEAAVILLDLVLGYGAHTDPAGHLAATLASHAGQKWPIVVASVTGTDGDPQGLTLQIAKLEAAGVHVAPSNADAAAFALACTRGEA